MFVLFLPIFMVDTKILYSYNFVASLELQCFKNFKLSLCDYSDISILIKGTISVASTADAKIVPHLKNFMTEIDNTQVDNVQDIDVVRSKYNLSEYNNNY